MKYPSKDNWVEILFLKNWHPYAWIILLGILVYFKTVNFDFVHFDDIDLITANHSFLSDIANISRAFANKLYSSLPTPYYRPILMVSFILDAQLGGTAPFIYHLTNIEIHLLASCAVFALLVKLDYKRGLALIFSLLFTVHPVLTQAVAWVPGRNDSLLAFFAILSFIFFLDFVNKKGRPYYFLHLAFLAFAIFTKESGMALILVCFLYLLLIGKKIESHGILKRLLPAYIFLGIVWFLARYIALFNLSQPNLASMLNLVFYQLPSVIQLFGKIVFPVNLSGFPTMQGTTYLYGAAALVLIAVLLIVSKKRRNNFVIFGICWFVFFLLPTLIRPHAALTDDVLEHRVYLPMIGLIIMLMEADIIKQNAGKKRFYGLAVLVIFVFAVATSCYSDNFAGKAAFWKSVLKTSPDSTFAHWRLGEMYYNSGEDDKAEAEFRKAMRLDYKLISAGGHYYLGQIYLNKGLMKESEAEFRKAITVDKRNFAAYTALGVLKYKEGKGKEAEFLWLRALALHPNYFLPNRNLSIYYYEQKEFQKSAYYARRLEAMGCRVPDEFLNKLKAAVPEEGNRR